MFHRIEQSNSGRVEEANGDQGVSCWEANGDQDREVMRGGISCTFKLKHTST